MVILAQRWAESYMREHPETRIQVTGGGSGTGFAALQNLTTDLATASRAIKPREVASCIRSFKQRPLEYRVALDGIIVYVHPDNALEEISLEDLERIFTGQVTNWSALGGPDAPITAYSRENSSGTYEFFRDHALRGNDFSPRIQMMPGTAAVLHAVANDRYSIGYGSMAFSNTARWLRLKPDPQSASIPPNRETITNRRYPLWRYLFVYLSPERDTGETGDFVKWIRSPAGQALAEQAGYFPLPEADLAVRAPEVGE
jgi:phosphate transport system substrate-binding protein